nr:ShlB/FhaC/HecB family hemolysin secretion/activation protein [Nostocaceae cyanobacterium]
KEAAPINAAFTIENRDSPSVGSIRGTATLSDQNLLGLGDRVTGEISYTAGSDNYDINYAIPLNARDGTLSLRYANSNSRIIEEPFSPLDILGHTKTFSVGFRQPVIRTPSSEFTLSFTTDLRESRTYLLKNIPYSFSTGPENGKSKVTVLRFGQEWINRTPQRVLAARSQFNIGVDALGATVNNTGVDGRFFSWLGQFQLVQKLGKDVVGVARIATQLSPNSLLPLEQFSFGGVDTVRGYRQNQFVADNGITGSLEVRFPVVNNPNGFGTLQVAPFVDIGKVWNTNDIGVDNRLFASTGLSLR